MNSSMNPWQRAVLVVVLLLGVVAVVYRHQRHQDSAHPVLTPGGIWVNNTHGKVPGNPQHAIEQMHELFSAIQIYRKRHGGWYPRGMADVMADMVMNFHAYGLPSWRRAVNRFDNPDARYSDIDSRPDVAKQARATNVIPYMMRSKRPDGQPIGGPTRPGTRDLLAWTDIYLHQNLHIVTETHGTSNPVGFYLALWADGQVTKIPYDRVLYIQHGNDFADAFPGEAGVPPGALTLREFRQKFHVKA